MKRFVWPAVFAGVIVGAPAFAHFGAHGDLAGDRLVEHVFTSFVHLAPFALVIVGLGAAAAWEAVRVRREDDSR